ncbi:golgin subfamily A member 4-like isoform X3 [Anthonomus grandis grandis]|nr:golgin subfamily A member 4-like isoform X3 [Anthonomus grandis grandis]
MGNLCGQERPNIQQEEVNNQNRNFIQLQQKISQMQRKIEDQERQILEILLDRQKLEVCLSNLELTNVQINNQEEQVKNFETNYEETLKKIASVETCIKNVRSYIIEWEKRMLATNQINKTQAEKLDHMQDKLTSLEVLCSKQEFMEKCLDYYGSVLQKVEELEKIIQETPKQDIQAKCDVLYDNYLVLYKKIHKLEKTFEGTSIQELFDILKGNYMLLEDRVCQMEQENWKEKYDSLNEKYIGLQRRVQYLGQFNRKIFSNSWKRQGVNKKKKGTVKPEKEGEDQCWTSVESLPTLVIESRK